MLPAWDLIVIPTNLKEPGFNTALNDLRKDYLFASAATVLLISPADEEVRFTPHCCTWIRGSAAYPSTRPRPRC